MKETQAISVFAALAQETRLRIVRILVQAGPLGMPAGTIAEKVGVSASNVSFHLKELEHAGIITARREARSIIYSAEYGRLTELIQFLMKDCCSGHPEIMTPALLQSCTPKTKSRARA